jgi:hypothetical protein
MRNGYKTKRVNLNNRVDEVPAKCMFSLVL